MERRMSPKGSRTVWSGGKDEDNIKVLPIAIYILVVMNLKMQEQ